MLKYYNKKNDTSNFLIPLWDVYLYKLYYVEPTDEIRLKIFKLNILNVEEIGTFKYYDTHLLIGQYFLMPDGKLYTEYEYRLMLFKLSQKEERKFRVSQVFNFFSKN